MTKPSVHIDSAGNLSLGLAGVEVWLPKGSYTLKIDYNAEGGPETVISVLDQNRAAGLERVTISPNGFLHTA